MASFTKNPETKNGDSTSTETIVVPDDFYCPITGELMNNPVSEKSGHSYERDSIMEWLSRNQTSPITRLPLTSNSFKVSLFIC